MNPMKSKILEDSNLDSRTLDSNLHSELGHLSHIACLSPRKALHWAKIAWFAVKYHAECLT